MPLAAGMPRRRPNRAAAPDNVQDVAANLLALLKEDGRDVPAPPMGAARHAMYPG